MKLVWYSPESALAQPMHSPAFSATTDENEKYAQPAVVSHSVVQVANVAPVLLKSRLVRPHFVCVDISVPLAASLVHGGADRGGRGMAGRGDGGG